jgi:hypothetical protein
MSGLVFLALVTSLVFGLVAWFGRRDAFVVRLTDTGARKVRGDPPKGFVDDCGDIARMHKLKKGEVRAVRKGGALRLRFSDDIPGHHHQRFRNAFTARRKRA